jgi:hypothetical protein
VNQPQRRRPNQPRSQSGNHAGNNQGNQASSSVRGREPKVPDMWRSVPALADPQPIVTVDDPTALVRSLGDPPLPGKSVVSGHYVAAVVERAAALAAALATSADLLVDPSED